MQTELEAKFLDVEPEKIRAKLKELGATLMYPERVMRRKNFDFSDLRLEKIGGWVRVRDEGDKVTLSYKQSSDRTLHGTKEVEVVVSNFETACDFLTSIGLVEKTYQETKREKWALGEIEITIDTWPWIPPCIEIEGVNEESLKNLAGKLGFMWGDALHGDVSNAYQKYFDVSEKEIYSYPLYIFDSPCPWTKLARKNS